jgi:hypothetical protein
MGVHLMPTSRKAFVSALLYNAVFYFTTEVINLEEVMDTDERDAEVSRCVGLDQIQKEFQT